LSLSNYFVSFLKYNKVKPHSRCKITFILAHYKIKCKFFMILMPEHASISSSFLQSSRVQVKSIRRCSLVFDDWILLAKV